MQIGERHETFLLLWRRNRLVPWQQLLSEIIHDEIGVVGFKATLSVHKIGRPIPSNVLSACIASALQFEVGQSGGLPLVQEYSIFCTMETSSVCGIAIYTCINVHLYYNKSDERFTSNRKNDMTLW